MPIPGSAASYNNKYLQPNAELKSAGLQSSFATQITVKPKAYMNMVTYPGVRLIAEGIRCDTIDFDFIKKRNKNLLPSQKNVTKI